MRRLPIPPRMHGLVARVIASHLHMEAGCGEMYINGRMGRCEPVEIANQFRKAKAKLVGPRWLLISPLGPP